MRITEGIKLSGILQAESRASQRLNQLSSQAATGLAVSQPSDDPAAYASIVQRNAQISNVQARSSAAKTAAGDLTLAEGSLGQAGDLVAKAHEIAIQASNGTLDPAARADSAKQVDALKQELLAIANTQGASGYLFGGTRNNAPPFDASARFSGNDGTTHVEVADGVLAVSNASGANAFTSAGGRDVFADLQTLSDALTNNDISGARASIDNLGTSQTQLVSARVDAGERSARLSSASDAMTNALTQMQISLGSVQNADPASTFSNFQAMQTAYEQAIQVNKQVLQVALQTGN